MYPQELHRIDDKRVLDRLDCPLEIDGPMWRDMLPRYLGEWIKA